MHQGAAHESTVRKLDGFAGVGLLTARDTTSVATYGGAGQPARSYRLTEEGRRQLGRETTRYGPGEPGFCYGEPRVQEILTYSEPAAGFGQTASQVRYSYEIVGVPGWARSEQLQAASEQLQRAARSKEEPFEGTAILILSDRGWVHQDELRR